MSTSFGKRQVGGVGLLQAEDFTTLQSEQQLRYTRVVRYFAGMNNVSISDQLEDVDFEFVYQFLSEESIWAKGIDRDTQQQAMNNSLCFSALRDKTQIGFARVVTDYATFAWVDDVFVDESERGNGIAHQLLTAIKQHHRLRTVVSWWLSSSNPVARSLFESHGFTQPDAERLAKLMAMPKRLR